MGKTIYLSDAELELLSMVFDYGNYSCEGSPDEEEKMEVAESLRKKVNKALYSS
jgi:ArsR family metal-binding transcriptional regulator